MISKHVSEVKKEVIDPVEFIHKTIEQVKKINDEYNYITVISEERALEQAEKVKKEFGELKREEVELTKELKKLVQENLREDLKKAEREKIRSGTAFPVKDTAAQ